MAPSGESSRLLFDELVPPLQLVSSSPFLFFLKNAETSLLRMRLFGYIAVFAHNVRDDERTIWRRTRWGRGGPQREAHVRWGR
jgi:hypothetical protein